MADQATQQYKIKRADIGAARMQDTVINIANLIVEINLFENIDKPYVSGKIVMVDDNNILDAIDFRGSETLSMDIVGIFGTVDVLFSRTFRISSIEKAVRTSERTDLYTLSIIDTHAFDSKANRFSKSYTGKIEDIIRHISASELGVEVSAVSAKPSTQPPMKVVVPYMDPLQACSWLKDRVTTSTGAPYYIYSSMHYDGLKIADLDTLMNQVPFNRSVPFIYSTATQSQSTELGMPELRRSFTIANYDRENIENTLQMIDDGAVGSIRTNTDIAGAPNISAQYHIDRTLDMLQEAGTIGPTQKQNVYDYDTFINHGTLGPVLASESPARWFHKISSSKVYDTSYNFSDDIDEQAVRNQVKKNAIHSMLDRNAINIVVPGGALLQKKVSVGHLVTLHFFTSNVKGKISNLDDALDNNRSGDYIILSTRHIFKDTTHFVSMQVTKLAKGEVAS